MNRQWLLAALCCLSLCCAMRIAELHAQSQSSGAKPSKQFPYQGFSRTPATPPNHPDFGKGPTPVKNDPAFGSGPAAPKNDPDFGTGPVKPAAGEVQTTRSGGFDHRVGRAYWEENTFDPKTGHVERRHRAESPVTNRQYELRQSYDPASGTLRMETVRGDRRRLGQQTELRASQNLVTGERSRTTDSITQTPWGTRRVLRTQTIDPITGQRRVDRGESFAPPGVPASEPAISRRLYYDPFTGVYHRGSPAVNAWPRPVPFNR